MKSDSLKTEEKTVAGVPLARERDRIPINLEVAHDSQHQCTNWKCLASRGT